MIDSEEVKSLDGPRYVVVEGPIGVGKTTLARRLSQSFASELLLEEAGENPFLARFYKNRRQTALATQLYFLLQRARQIEQLRQRDLFSPVRIADFLFEKDRLFAELNLDSTELALYDEVAEQLSIDPPQPDLVIYLQAPAPVLLQRVAGRGVDYERYIDADYLERLGNAYAKFFHDYDAAPLLIVNAASIDPIHRESDYRELLERIIQIRSGRHFYNPVLQSIS